MSRPLERRLERLERGTSLGLPWGRPLVEWTDGQLLALLDEGSDESSLVTDQRLVELIAQAEGVPQRHE